MVLIENKAGYHRLFLYGHGYSDQNHIFMAPADVRLHSILKVEHLKCYAVWSSECWGTISTSNENDLS